MPKVSYWPPEAPSELTISAFEKAFQSVGYASCKDGKPEEGFEKIALYAKKTPSGPIPTHAARQLAGGKWTSKMGPLQDIEHHKPGHVTGPVYGAVVGYMKRRLQDPLTTAEDAGPSQANES